MTRKEFMNRLEYLLSDISDEEKGEALQYYEDYFEEAGPDREAEVAAGFGSPERVAAIIRADISGTMKEGGSFTDRGYEDERFRDPNYEVRPRFDLPQEKAPKQSKAPWTNGFLKAILWIILICVAVPGIFGIGTGAVGLVALIIFLPLVVFFALGLASVVLCLAAFVAFAGGLITCIVNPAAGMLVLGISLVIMAVGAVFLMLSILVYGKLLPFFLNRISGVFNRLFHRRRA